MSGRRPRGGQEADAAGAQPPAQNPRRQRLLDLITREPGIGSSTLARAAGVPPGTLRHHLRILARQGLIVERRLGRIRRFFAGRARYGAAWRAVALLQDPHLRRLHAALRERPRSRPDVALDAFISWGWSRSTTYHRLARLEACGLLRRVPGGEGLQALDLPGVTARGRPVAPRGGWGPWDVDEEES